MTTAAPTSDHPTASSIAQVIEDLTVQLPHGFRWEPHHTITDHVSTWVDGRLIPPSGTDALAVDVGCAGDDCCVTAEHVELAQRRWDEGSVYLFRPASGVPSLLVPSETLDADTVREAVRRFHP